MAVTMIGSGTATAARDNAPARWDDKRIVQTPGVTDGSVHVLSNRGSMTTVVRELGAGTDVWRIRENRDRGLAFHPPVVLPREVQRFRYDRSQLDNSLYAAYEHNGRLWAAEASPERAIAFSLTSLQVIDGGLAPAGQEAPKVVAGESSADHALITQGGTWHQHTGPVGGVPEEQPQGNPQGPAWVSYPDPNVDGVPGNGGEDYATAGDDNLLVFWNDADGDLRFAHRRYATPAAPFSAPKTIAADEKYVDFVQTMSQGAHLVTRSADGSLNLYTYQSPVVPGPSFDNGRVLAGPESQSPVQVLVDDGRDGTVAVGWRERAVDGGGLVLWQLDRPGSAYLERPTLVPGTRDADAKFTVAPRGSITVAVRRADGTGIVRVKHLPAGKERWTRGVRLVSPRPISGAWQLGSPQRNGDLRVVVNDARGVYGFRFDAPRPYTVVTKPVRTTQAKPRYTVAWNTSWGFAKSWEVRFRVDKGKRYSPWRWVSGQDRQWHQSAEVKSRRGETRCYQARARGEVDTKWSKQRCVTVRR